MVLPVVLTPERKAEMLVALGQMRADQIMLRLLIPMGWTIQTLCDLLIDGDLTDLPPAIELEITALLKPEWVLARRSERAQLELAHAMADFTLELRGLRELISTMFVAQARAEAAKGSTTAKRSEPLRK